MGATLYGSAPLYAPDDRDGTLLLKPGQKGYYVPGEAWGALRYQDYALLTGYRQKVDQPYINPQDNRMTPNTFQGVTLGGKVDWLQYLGGYLWQIKPRNSDEFISMSQQAGGAREQQRRRRPLRRAADAARGAADRPEQPVRGQHVQHLLRRGRLPLAPDRELEAAHGRPVHGSARRRRRAPARGRRQAYWTTQAGRRPASRRSTGTSPSRARSRSRAPATPSRTPGGAFPATSR